MSEMKNIIYRTSNRLEFSGEKVSEFEGIAIETVQDEIQREKTNFLSLPKTHQQERQKSIIDLQTTLNILK